MQIGSDAFWVSDFFHAVGESVMTRCLLKRAGTIPLELDPEERGTLVPEPRVRSGLSGSRTVRQFHWNYRRTLTGLCS